MATEPTRRRALPWPAVIAATVLALLAAGAVLVVLGDDDGDGDGREASPLSLVPVDGAPAGDPLDVGFTDPGDDEPSGTLRSLLDGRPLVVNFFQSYCAPCISEMPDFETVSKELAGRVDFFGLAVQDRPEDAADIVERTGITYPWSRDIAGEVIAATGSVVMPTTVFVTADGTVAEVHAGSLDDDDLRSMIRTHLGVPA